MTSVIAFVIRVDWLRCKANCQTLLGGDDIVLSEKRRVVLSISLCTDVPLPREWGRGDVCTQATYRSVCHGDWNQDRMLLIFYKKSCEFLALGLSIQRLVTFLAAIFEVPTTFPSFSFTWIPVNSSWFLIRTTLQMFAVATRHEWENNKWKKHRTSLSLFA